MSSRSPTRRQREESRRLTSCGRRCEPDPARAGDDQDGDVELEAEEDAVAHGWRTVGLDPVVRDAARDGEAEPDGQDGERKVDLRVNGAGRVSGAVLRGQRRRQRTHDARDEDARDALGELLNLGLAAHGALDGAADALDHGVLAEPVDAHNDGLAPDVDRPGQDLVAGALGDGPRLARQRRFVERRLAPDDGAVRGRERAGPDKDQVGELEVRDGDLGRREAAERLLGLGRERAVESLRQQRVGARGGDGLAQGRAADRVVGVFRGGRQE